MLLHLTNDPASVRCKCDQQHARQHEAWAAEETTKERRWDRQEPYFPYINNRTVIVYPVLTRRQSATYRITMFLNHGSRRSHRLRLWLIGDICPAKNNIARHMLAVPKAIARFFYIVQPHAVLGKTALMGGHDDPEKRSNVPQRVPTSAPPDKAGEDHDGIHGQEVFSQYHEHSIVKDTGQEPQKGEHQ
jgi:hypothetical protein